MSSGGAGWHRCPRCDALLDPGGLFCGACGGAVAGGPPPPPPPAATTQAVWAGTVPGPYPEMAPTVDPTIRRDVAAPWQATPAPPPPPVPEVPSAVPYGMASPPISAVPLGTSSPGPVGPYGVPGPYDPDTAMLPVVGAEARRRRWGPIVGVVAALAALGVAAIAVTVLRSDDGKATTATSLRPAPSTSPVTAAPATTASSTSTTAVPAPTATSVAPPETAATVVVPAASTTVPEPPPTVPVPTDPPPTDPPTTPAPVTVPPTPRPTPPPTLPPPEVPGDLHLSIPMTQPACDGQFITIVASAVMPGKYVEQVATSLDQRPGSQYLRTDQTCPSLRPDFDGDPIYVVYYGPFGTQQEACDNRVLGPQDAYVKRLDLTSAFTTPWICN